MTREEAVVSDLQADLEYTLRECPELNLDVILVLVNVMVHKLRSAAHVPTK